MDLHDAIGVGASPAPATNLIANRTVLAPPQKWYDFAMSLDKMPPRVDSSTESSEAQAWKSIEGSVNDSLSKIFQEVHGQSGLYAENEQADALDRLQSNEKAFFTNVLQT